MKKLLVGAVGVLAIEVLLLWGYFALVGEGVGITNRNVAAALLVGTVSVVVWFGFVWSFGRLVLAVVGCIVVTYVALVVAVFLELPTAVVCDRSSLNTEVEISTTRAHGYFVKRHVLECTLYTHKSRTPPGITYDGGGIYSD